MSRYATIVVVEARDADEAYREVLDPIEHGTIVYIGDPVPVVDSDDYDSYGLANAIRYYVGLPDGRPHMVRMEGSSDEQAEREIPGCG